MHGVFTVGAGLAMTHCVRWRAGADARHYRARRLLCEVAAAWLVAEQRSVAHSEAVLPVMARAIAERLE